MPPPTHERSPTGNHQLASLDGTDPTRGNLRGFFAIAAGGSLYAWDVAFEFGAHHAVFYHRRQQLLVLSLVVLFGGLIMRRQVPFPWWQLVVFGAPILVIILQLANPIRVIGPIAEDFSDVITVAYIVAAPVGLWIIARLLAPQFFTLPDRRAKVGVVAIMVAIAAIGFLVGKYNNQFLTCGDFQVAGEEQPANCVHSKDR
jgi:hypothetical protein